MRPFLLVLFIVSALTAQTGARQPATRTVTGVITDSMCATGDHSRMKMGPTDAECTVACINAHGALYVLYDGKEVYALSDQQNPEKFAGQRVAVTGTVDAKTKAIKITAMIAAK